ncbi:MAG TPA: heterodisulfide reductase subunit A [Nitrospiraceae bacterium]|nr:MAG: heterodisulfide reductase subunit A [Nitrospirae bacterium GWA2_46_11]OGW25815.1 MAG: heterodisulfide reductase subunit A [Nitrospirae bacterium GWB2_47_37]HCZ10919.1 heterodisulfide reductase subunit A [Nitrospiraceae bacterium]
MEKNIGLYICTGCSIGDSIDVEKLGNIAKNSLKIPVVKSHFAMCGKEGVELIKNDIKNEGVNTVVIAACSPRIKYEEFDFPGCIVERSPLRELAVWTQEDPEERQLAAEDYVKMHVIKAQKGDLPEPYMMETVKTILVIGGGISGMTSALQAANAGYQVVLVEKEAQLGGFANKLYKVVPAAMGEYSEPLIVDSDIADTVKAVESNQNITVYKSAKVEKTDGQPGAYDVTISSNGNSEVVKIGSIVLAAGWRPYDATKLEHLGYGVSKDVVTNIELEGIAKNNGGRILRPSDGKEAKKVAFIQCAGQRDPNHLPYCSAMCCTTSLKQARYVTQNSDATAMILYKDIRTPGRLEYYYKAAQNDPAVMMTKGDVTSVTDAGNGNLHVEMENSLLGEKVKIEADLVVLATGVVPATADDPILNLQYKQGPGLPDLELFDGFADSNFICFQYETRRTGVYAAGCVRQPMNMSEAQEDATGAALKAIQSAEHVAAGIAVHPRAWDMTYPDPFMQRCTSCKRCTEECPFGAIDEDEKGTPFYKPGRCRRCATCMGACPERIVSFKDYHVDMIGSMMKNVSVPSDDDKPRIIVLACENDAYPAIDTAALKHMKIDSAVRIIQLRCLGSTNLVWIADALSRGVDGMLLLGCKFGENYQCHFAKGSELADYRLSKVQETLGRLQLEAERVQMIQLAIDEYDNVPRIIGDFVERVKEIGPNPFKGF